MTLGGQRLRSVALEERNTRSDLERRLSPRTAARLPVQLYCEGLSGGLQAVTNDVGTGGVCVQTRCLLATASIRRLVVDLPDGPAELNAQGRWQRETAEGQLTGICFIDPDKSAQRRLREFVYTRAAELADFLVERTALSDLSLDEGLDLALFTRFAEFSPRQLIYRQEATDTAAGSSFIVYEGTVILKGYRSKGQPVAVGRIGVGGLFGGLPVLAGVPPVTSAYAEAASILLEIDSYTFRYLQDAKPWVARRLQRALISAEAANLRALVERLGNDRRS